MPPCSTPNDVFDAGEASRTRRGYCITPNSKRNNEKGALRMIWKRKRDMNWTNSADKVLRDERDHLKKEPCFGIALSGGGIRSASFALGVLQAFASLGLLKKVDYLSTVSGGGYIAAALVWWLKEGLPTGITNTRLTTENAGVAQENFPFGSFRTGTNSIAQNAVLNFLRVHCNYLIPSRGLDLWSIVGTILRNMFISLSLHLGVLILLCFLPLQFLSQYPCR